MQRYFINWQGNIPKALSLCGFLLATTLSFHNAYGADTQSVASHGTAVGDVTSSSAVVWARGSHATTMHVVINGNSRSHYGNIAIKAEDDFTGKIAFNDLTADTIYDYEVWFSSSKARAGAQVNGTVSRGEFTTAPDTTDNKAVSFAWGGDLAGQNVCRDVDEGFPIFKAINTLNPDFFVGLGDMIYADNTCGPIGRYGNTQIPGDFQASSTLSDFWSHWKYSREDSGFQTLLASTPYFAIWDDHEVVNDFGPLHDTRNNAPYTPGEKLLPMGLKAFIDYNPVINNHHTPERIYRNIRWGKHLELIVLDNRQYRDANSVADEEDLPKTMLGREQLSWLKGRLKSDATWKVIISSVPISIPTGWPADKGRDGWANFDQDTGFEQELLEIMGYMKHENIDNVIFITTDVHFAEVFRYTPFADEPDFQIHEYVTGPLNAGLFPNRDFDKTLGTESLFFFGPESTSAVNTFEEAKQWMNFGAISVDVSGVMTVSVRDIDGKPLYELTHQPK